MKIELVSCFYSKLHNTEFQGRASRHHHYICSLKSLQQMNLPVHVFTSQSQTSELKSYNDNVKLHVDELSSLPVYQKINSIKKHVNLVPQRCYEIMYSKTKWLRDIINTTNSDYYFWIDVGLSHNGIFPKSMKRTTAVDHCSKYFDFDVFNQQLIPGLIERAQGKIYSICFDQSTRKWNAYIDSKYIDNPPAGQFHMVGGLFGGEKSMMIKFCDEFDSLLDRIIKDGVLPTEEEVYTAVVNNNKHMFFQDMFNSWYYEGHDLYESWTANLDKVTPFCNLFKV